MNITYIDNSGEANWFDVDGVTYGVSTTGDNIILCDDGLPMPQEFYQLGDNQELIELLLESSKAA